MKKIISTCVLITVLSACSTKAPEDPGKASPPKAPKIVGSPDKAGTSFDALQLANELESNHVAEIRFKSGSAELTNEARKKLNSVMKEAKSGDSIKKVKLITWADQEMPAEKKGSLSEEQVELAKRRNDSLSRFIQSSYREIDIDRISMAERPQGLKDLIPTETARIQESLNEAGVPEMGESKKGLGKASRSIIIFTRE